MRFSIEDIITKIRNEHRHMWIHKKTGELAMTTNTETTEFKGHQARILIDALEEPGE